MAAAAWLLAGCAPEPASTTDTKIEDPGPPPRMEDPRIIPIPAIPAALHGCWISDEPDDPGGPGYPDGGRVVIAARSFVRTSEGVPRRVATAEYVTRVTPTLIKGLFSAPENGGRATIATSLEIGDGVDRPAGQLILREGDAGSYFYSRCAS